MIPFTEIPLTSLYWLLANVGFAYIFPIVLFKFVQQLDLPVTKEEQRDRMRVSYLVKEGQFALTSVAISAASFYELITTSESLKDSSGITLLILTIVLAFFNSLVFLFGTISTSPSPTDVVKSGTTIREWLKIYKAGAMSIYLAIGVSFCAFAVHNHCMPKSSPPKVEQSK